jgi:hypothetical protein
MQAGSGAGVSTCALTSVIQGCWAAGSMRPIPPAAPQPRSAPCRPRGALRAISNAAAAVVATDAAAVDAAWRAADAAGGFFAPPLSRAPARLLRHGVPFLTLQAGALPMQPRSLEHALELYGSYTSKYCSVRVENVHVRLQSWEEGVAALRVAEAARQPYWCSLIERVQHAAWWPEEGHVSTYDQVRGCSSGSTGCTPQGWGVQSPVGVCVCAWWRAGTRVGGRAGAGKRGVGVGGGVQPTHRGHVAAQLPKHCGAYAVCAASPAPFDGVRPQGLGCFHSVGDDHACMLDSAQQAEKKEVAQNTGLVCWF